MSQPDDQSLLTLKGNDAPPQRTRINWNDEHDAILRRNYTRKGAAHTAALLSRSINSVQARALRLGIPGMGLKMWTEREIDYVRRKYDTLTARQIGRALHRSEESIRGKITELGLTQAVSRPWSAEESAFLHDHYATMSCEEIGERLGRTPEAVQLRAARNGIAKRGKAFRPTPAQHRYIVENLGKIPFTRIARKLGTKTHFIQKIAGELGYRDRPTSRPWTDEDDRRLREIYGTMSRTQVAETLGRTMPAVAVRASALGLTRTIERTESRPWTPREETLLKRRYGIDTVTAIAERLGRTPASVQGHATAMGLRRRKNEEDHS